MKHLKTFESFGGLVGKDLYVILTNVYATNDAQIDEVAEELKGFDLELIDHKITGKDSIAIIVKGDKENILEYTVHGDFDESDIAFTTEPVFPQELMESVRHGHFPYFSIDRTTYDIRFDTASNDLAVDAINYNDSKTHFSFCSENWSMAKCRMVADEVSKMLRAGKSDKEIREFLEPHSY